MQGGIRKSFRSRINPVNLPSVLFLAQSASASLPPRNHLAVRIGLTDKGRWNPDMKLWVIRHGNIRGTALVQHIILYAAL